MELLAQKGREGFYRGAVAEAIVAGTGSKFGGINAIEFNADGSLTGLADPRRTNAVGW